MKKKVNMKMIEKDIKTLKRGFSLVKRLSPGYLELSLTNAVFNAFIPYISIYMMAIIIDELILGNRDIQTLVIYVSVAIGGTLLATMVSHLISKRVNIKKEIFESSFQNYMNNIKLNLEFSQIEDPKYTDLREKIMANMYSAGGGITYLVGIVTSIVQNVISVIIALVIASGSFSVSSTVGNSNISIINSIWFSSLLIILIFICLFFGVKNTITVNKKVFRLYQDGATNNAYLEYYQDIYLEDEQAGKDVRIFDQRELIKNEILYKARMPWLNIVNGTYGLNRKYFSVNSVLSGLLGGLIYLFVGLRALSGSVSIGNVIKTYAAINNLVNAISALSASFTKLKSNNNYLEMLYEFLDLPQEKRDDEEIPKISHTGWEIEFHNVSFRYPSSEEYTLKNINLKLKPNSRTAVVGKNGSGKTTMIKLLCRLYEPESGYITLNGTDIRKYAYKAYIDFLSVVFQDFQLLAFSIGENLAAASEYDEVKGWRSLEKAGIYEKISKLSLKLEQPISNRFEEYGIDFSGGESQKIALARAIYKDAPIVIMDEPTSALDVVSEAEVYSNFNQMIDNKTAIYISHRLSSCIFCDTIIVFDEGKIIQNGAHNELLKDTSGKYYELWNTQAQYYISENSGTESTANLVAEDRKK